MTLCNMAIEAGARAGMVAADETTIYLSQGAPFAPQGEAWDKAVAYWNTLHSDDDAQFDKIVKLDAAGIKPQVTWGTSPEMVVSVDGRVPDPATISDAVKRDGAVRALKYMGLQANTPITEIIHRQGFYSDPVPMRALKICAPPPQWLAANISRRT